MSIRSRGPARTGLPTPHLTHDGATLALQRPYRGLAKVEVPFTRSGGVSLSFALADDVAKIVRNTFAEPSRCQDAPGDASSKEPWCSSRVYPSDGKDLGQ